MAHCVHIVYSVFTVAHRHFHRCNVPTLPHRLLDRHKAIITYVPIFLLCSCNAIYLLLTSFWKVIKPVLELWSKALNHVAGFHLLACPNLGQKGSSTYGCHITFYIIIGSDGAIRRIHWKWIDIYTERERCQQERDTVREPGKEWKGRKFGTSAANLKAILLTWMFAPDFRNNSQRVPLIQLSHGTGAEAESACTGMSGEPCPAGWELVSLQRWGILQSSQKRKASANLPQSIYWITENITRWCVWSDRKKAVQSSLLSFLKAYIVITEAFILTLYVHPFW